MWNDRRIDEIHHYYYQPINLHFYLSEMLKFLNKILKINCLLQISVSLNSEMHF